LFFGSSVILAMSADCSLNAWLKGLASGDQRRVTRSDGSALEACSRRCGNKSTVYFT